MSFKRMILPTVVCLVAGAGLADAAGAKHFGAYISCGQIRHHDSVCVSGDAPFAVFRAFRHANVNYRLCVRNPHGRHHCRSEQTGARGERDLVHIAAGDLGRYAVTWKIHGNVIDRDSYLLKPEPA
jgi:hypothetical protein